MSELTPEVLSGLQESFEASTSGHWHKGSTTHHTVCDGNGLRAYPIAEFHHASDAEFCDNAHQFMPLLLSEIIALRAENDSLKEVISLAEDSRLMGEYLKLERANARQAARIAELEEEDTAIHDLKDKTIVQQGDQLYAQSSVIEQAKTALEEAQRVRIALARWRTSSFGEAYWDQLANMTSEFPLMDSALAAINALPEGVAEKCDVPGIDDLLGEMGVAFRMFTDTVIKPKFVTLTRREQVLAESAWRCSWESRSLLTEKKARER